jgi:hypothetical protein
MNEYQKKLKGYYPDDDMLRTLSEDHVKLTIVEATYSKADDLNQKKVFSKANNSSASKPPTRSMVVYFEKISTAFIKV